MYTYFSPLRFTVEVEKTGDFLAWFYMFEKDWMLQAAETNKNPGTRNFQNCVSHYLLSYTVDKNIIANIKMRNNFCNPLKIVIFPILR